MNKGYMKAIIGTITLAVMVVLVVVAVSATKGNGNSSSQPAATSVVAAVAVATPVPATTLAPTPIPLPSPTPLPLPTSTLLPTQVAVGQVIPKVYNKPEVGVTVVRAADVPLISQDMALQILVKQIGGMPFGYGEAGNTVTLDATYGLVTEGSPSSAGWMGHRNLPLKDGEVLDHIENRSMWVLEFRGVDVMSSDQSCTQAKTCTPHPLNHALYLIDAKAMQVTIGKNYYAP